MYVLTVEISSSGILANTTAGMLTEYLASLAAWEAGHNSDRSHDEKVQKAGVNRV